MVRRTGGRGSGELDLVRLQVASGVIPHDLSLLPARARRSLEVARSAGSPLLPALDVAIAADEDEQRAERALAVATAQARTVAAGLLAAPVVLVPLLGRLAGSAPWAFYVTPSGQAVLVVALLLLATGAGLVVAILRRARGARRAANASIGRSGELLGAGAAGLLAWLLLTPVLAVPATVAVYVLLVRRRGSGSPDAEGLDEAVDLIASALGGGQPVPQALRMAAVHHPLAPGLRRLAIELELGALPATGRDRDDQAGGLSRLRALLLAAESTGAPLVPALRRTAAHLRADREARALAAVERLPAQLTFPTALCLLPATVLLVGAPLVHGGLGALGA